ncbi:uncharacterized protein EV154DRAFT_493962 [Mucor mucedo]|uniref:uncharacterized protein n=1 Tax=Mucor mucedo TaxID=29922 RepID=UPI00221EC9A8|nr:uncharacterized protein EV154DRAFT_493962 [Mucor mucedo]KAI7895857.1 hypothetical protein EV154DRAFT_493962 [Mucor mucedo]
MARSKRNSDKAIESQDNKRICLENNADQKTPLVAEQSKSEKEAVSAGEIQNLNYTIEACANKAIFKPEEKPELLTKEENYINLLTKENFSSNDLSDEFGSCDETSDYDEYEYSDYDERETVTERKNNSREPSTDSETDFLSINSASSGSTPAPVLPVYHSFGVSLHNPYKGMDLTTVIKPPFSIHWKRNNFTSQTEIPPVKTRIDAAVFHQREADMLALLNGPFIIAARSLSASVCSNTPSVLKREQQ